MGRKRKKIVKADNLSTHDRALKGKGNEDDWSRQTSISSSLDSSFPASLKLKLLIGLEDMWEKHKEHKEVEPTTSDTVPTVAHVPIRQNDQLSSNHEFILDGMKQFSFNGTRISRAIVIFTQPPKPFPQTICFQIPYYIHLTHAYVLGMVKQQILESKLSASKPAVDEVQFVDRNVIHGTRKMDNRWIIKLADKEIFNRLLRSGIKINGVTIATRSYDSVLQEEYVEYQKYEKLQYDMFLKLKQLEELRKGKFPESQGELRIVESKPAQTE